MRTELDEGLLGSSTTEHTLSPKSLASCDLKSIPRSRSSPKGPCTPMVYTLTVKYPPYRYIGPKVYTIWVHGRFGQCEGFMG